ncbi:MAG: glycosyltransferase [Sphingomonadales bacterium]|nr:glycosyltransferase [Sphingomonadales bacterium]
MVSVCIANFNGMAVIDECLRSVLEQEGHIPIEILVHDDASSDDSVAHMRSTYPDVRLIASQENVGFCIANNRMAGEAKGKYLLLLNNDAALYPNAIRTLLTEADRLDQPAILGLPQYDAASGELIDIGSLLDPFLNPVPNKDPERGPVGMVMGACLWIPSALWQELDGFPEWFGSIGEDLYLCCRARLAGYPVNAVGVSGYCHHVGQSFGGGKVNSGRLSSTFRRRALSERNKTFVLTMTYPTPYMQPMLPIHLLLLLLEGGLLSLLHGRIAYLKEIYLPVFSALFLRRKKLLAARRLIMKSAHLPGSAFFAVFDPLPHKLRMLIRHGLPILKS